MARDDATKLSEARWAEEQTWPLFQVEIEGDEVPWVPRANTTYWEPKDPDDPDSKWVPKSEGLPKHARVENGQIVMKATATTTCRAKSEEMAKMMALRDNPEYHTVASVKKVKEGE